MKKVADHPEEMTDENGSTVAWVCKGHLSPEEFMEEMEHAGFYPEGELPFAKDDVEQTWGRKVPDRTEHRGYFYHYGNYYAGQRGAFKATQVWLG